MAEAERFGGFLGIEDTEEQVREALRDQRAASDRMGRPRQALDVSPGTLARRVLDKAYEAVTANPPQDPIFREALDASYMGATGSRFGEESEATPAPYELAGTASGPEPYYTWWDRYVSSPFGRGVDRFQAMVAYAAGDAEEYAAQHKEMLDSAPYTQRDLDVLRKIDQTDSILEALKLFASNPRLVTSVAAESTGTQAAGFAAQAGATLAGGAVGGPIGAAAGLAGSVALTSGLISYGAKIEEMLADQGVDLTNAEQVNAAFQNEAMMSKIREAAVDYAVPVAVVDGITALVAGKLVKFNQGRVSAAADAGRIIGRARRMAQATAAYGGELAMQAGGGMTGEALGQINERGEVYAPGEVAAEGIAEVPTAIPETMLGIYGARKPPAAKPTVPPGQEPPTGPATPPRSTEPLGEDRQMMLPLSTTIADPRDFSLTPPPSAPPPAAPGAVPAKAEVLKQKAAVKKGKKGKAAATVEPTQEEIDARLAAAAQAEEAAVEAEGAAADEAIAAEEAAVATGTEAPAEVVTEEAEAAPVTFEEAAAKAEAQLEELLTGKTEAQPKAKRAAAPRNTFTNSLNNWLQDNYDSTQYKDSQGKTRYKTIYTEAPKPGKKKGTKVDGLRALKSQYEQLYDAIIDQDYGESITQNTPRDGTDRKNILQRFADLKEGLDSTNPAAARALELAFDNPGDIEMTHLALTMAIANVASPGKVNVAPEVIGSEFVKEPLGLQYLRSKVLADAYYTKAKVNPKTKISPLAKNKDYQVQSIRQYADAMRQYVEWLVNQGYYAQETKDASGKPLVDDFVAQIRSATEKAIRVFGRGGKAFINAYNSYQELMPLAQKLEADITGRTAELERGKAVSEAHKKAAAADKEGKVTTKTTRVEAAKSEFARERAKLQEQYLDAFAKDDTKRLSVIIDSVTKLYADNTKSARNPQGILSKQQAALSLTNFFKKKVDKEQLQTIKRMAFNRELAEQESRRFFDEATKDVDLLGQPGRVVERIVEYAGKTGHTELPTELQYLVDRYNQYKNTPLKTAIENEIAAIVGDYVKDRQTMINLSEDEQAEHLAGASGLTVLGRKLMEAYSNQGETSVATAVDEETGEVTVVESDEALTDEEKLLKEAKEAEEGYEPSTTRELKELESKKDWAKAPAHVRRKYGKMTPEDLAKLKEDRPAQDRLKLSKRLAAEYEARTKDQKKPNPNVKTAVVDEAEIARKQAQAAELRRAQEIAEAAAPKKRFIPMYKGRTGNKLLAALRFGRNNKLERLAGSGFLSGLPFFEGLLERGGVALHGSLIRDAYWVAGFRNSLDATERKAFDTLIDDFINASRVFKRRADAASEPVTEKYRSLSEQVERGPLPAQYYEGEIAKFVTDRATNADKVRPAVIEYARSLRTLQNRGFEAGQIVLESRSAMQAYDNAIGRTLQTAGNTVYETLYSNADLVEEGANRFKLARLNLRQVLEAMQVDAGKNPWLSAIVDRLLETGIDVRIGVEELPVTANGANNPVARYDVIRQRILIDPAIFDNAVPKSLGEDAYYTHVGYVMRTVLHEALHAATTIAMARDPALKSAVEQLLDTARAALKDKSGALYYGLKNADEFVAEAFTNRAFQDILSQIPAPKNPDISLFQRFTQFVGRVLKLFKGKVNNSVLYNLMLAEDKLFATKDNFQLNTLKRVSAAPATLDLTRGDVQQNAKALQASLVDVFNNTHWIQVTTDKFRALHYWAAGLDSLERENRALLDRITKGNNPVTKLFNAVSHVAYDASKRMEEFSAIADMKRELGDEADALADTMALSTAAGVYLDKFNVNRKDPANAHLYDKNGNLKNEKAVRKAVEAWDKLSDKAKKAYVKAYQLTQDLFYRRRGSLGQYALQNMGMDKEAAKRFNMLYSNPATTWADVQKFVDDYVQKNPSRMSDPDSVLKLLKEQFNISKIMGPYFPLRRSTGRWVVVATDPDGENYFEIYQFNYQAQKDKAALQAAGYTNVAVSKFRINALPQSNITEASKAIVNRIRKTMPKGATPKQEEAFNKAKDAIEQTVLHMLAENTLFSARIRRKNVMGVHPKDIWDAYTDYVTASTNAIGTLESDFEYFEALREMRELADADMQTGPNAITEEESIRLVTLYNELALRSSSAAVDRSAPVVSKTLGAIGFYNYLAAPSFWILNATQTALTGIPQLAGLIAESGKAKSSVGSHRKAYKSWKSGMLRLKTLTKGLGMRALQDLDAIRARMTDDEKAMLDNLVEKNVIQSTLAYEAGNLMNQQIPVWRAINELFTTIPDMLERWNRIVMGLAALDAGLKDPNTIMDAVQGSQYNYNTEIRGRALKNAPQWLGGGMRQIWSPIMMFKVFAVNMAEMLYGNLYDSVVPDATIKDAATRAAKMKRARTVFGGILATHTLAGGMFGGLGIGAAQMIGEIFAGLFGDDYEPWEPGRALEQFIADHTNEYVASIATRGLPAAVGLDMSTSYNLGNLLWMTSDTSWAEYGGFQTSVFSLMGPIANYIEGGARSIARLSNGEIDAAQAMEKIIPFKMVRALLQTYRYNVDGLQTGDGKVFMGDEDYGIWASIISGTGLRPTSVSMAQDKFYSDRAYNRLVESTKGKLMADYWSAKGSDREAVRDEIRKWNTAQRERGNQNLLITWPKLWQSRKTSQRIQGQYDQGQFTEYNR